MSRRGQYGTANKATLTSNHNLKPFTPLVRQGSFSIDAPKSGATVSPTTVYATFTLLSLGTSGPYPQEELERDWIFTVAGIQFRGLRVHGEIAAQSDLPW